MPKASATSQLAATFRQTLLEQGPEQAWEVHVLSGEPFAFRGFPDALARLREHLLTSLGQPSDTEIFVVGSAKMGFSLDPNKPFASFHRNSDVDLVIISPPLFDDAWITLLRWYYPSFAGVTEQIGEPARWLREQRRSLWRGYLEPAVWIRLANQMKLLEDPRLAKAFPPVREISQRWFSALQKTGQLPRFPPYTLEGRLYRTRTHATMYHIDGLHQLKNAVLALEK